MPLNRSQQRYRLWLAAGTAVMAVAMAVLLSLQLTQKQAIADGSKLRIDSVTVLAFQMERELLRLQNTMERMVQSPSAADIDALLLRQDIFASRYQLMTDNPTVVVLLERAEYLQTMSKLKALIERTDAVLATAPRLEPAALRSLLQEIDQMAPDMQALTMVANTHITRQLEDQESALLKQADNIVWLILVQMVLLFLASATLTVQHRRQDKERRALQQLTRDLQHATAAAETANRGKSQFLATMSHELRTPFNGMLGMLTLLETTPLDVQQRDYLVTARSSAGHLLTLLNDILDVSALEAGRMDIHPTPICVPELFGDVQHLMQPLAAQKKLEFSMVIGAEVPTWLEADGTRLKQIVLNLVSNAIKFSEYGKVSIMVDCALEPPADCAPAQQLPAPPAASVALRIRVQDSGIGMDAATVDRLFQRFSQGDASTSRRFGGTGLGLEISRSLARLMGGDIRVASQVGEGSLFTVALRLPLAAAPPNDAVGAHNLLYRPEGVAGLDIVVAEDQAINRKYMAGLLERMGHQVRFAEDGVQAVAEVQRCTPDLVLMDLHMPFMDGLEATRRLRALVGTAAASVPVVALTADAFEETREQARAAGMTAFLSKPASADAIQTVLSDLFGTRGSPSAPSSAPPAPAPAAAAGHATDKAPPATVRKGPRRRFQAGDVARHLDMAMVGDVCIAISFNAYRSLADEFFQDKSGSLTALMQALRDRDSPQIHAAAHAFKGSSAMLGFHALAACALRIEQQGAAGELDALNEASTALGNAWTTVHAIAHRMAITSVDEPTSVTGLLAMATADTVPP